MMLNFICIGDSLVLLVFVR